MADNEFLFTLREKDSKYWECPYCKQRGRHLKRFIPYVYARDFGSHTKGEIVDANRFGACFSDKCEAYIGNGHNGIYPSKANGFVYDSLPNISAVYQNNSADYQNIPADYQNITAENSTTENAISLIDKKWLENYKNTYQWWHKEIKDLLITTEIDLHLNSTNPNHYDSELVTYLLNRKIVQEKNITKEKIIEIFRELGVMGGVTKTIQKGSITLSSKGTIYLQYDVNDNIRTGKIMYLDKNGHRIKKKSFEPYPTLRDADGIENLWHDWLHNIYKNYKNYNTKDKAEYRLKQCLFGLKRVKSKLMEGSLKEGLVCVYEADKTATSMSVLFPEYAHVSVGSVSQFSFEMLSSLQELGVRNVKVFPDKNCYKGWYRKSLAIDKQLNNREWLDSKGLSPIQIEVSKRVEDCPYLREGDDILDLLDLDFDKKNDEV